MAATPVLVLAVLLAATPVRAQFPDVLSAQECPGCAAAWSAEDATRLAGVWSSALTSAADPAWAPEDFACAIACTSAARIRAASASASELRAERGSYPLFEFACDKRGFAAQVVSPLPLEIEVFGGRVVLHYEEQGVTRTLELSGRETIDSNQRSRPSLLGSSHAHFEHGALVVETSGMEPRRFYDWFGGRSTSDQMRAIERYTMSGDGAWLELTLELVDPGAHSAPLVLTKRWRRVPGVEIAHYGCDVMSGQLEGVFDEYVDPAIVEGRRARAGLPTLSAVSSSNQHH
jgi:hypothetical protein